MDVKIEARIFWGDKHFRSPGFPFLHHELGTPREWCSALPLRSVDVQRGVRWTSKSAVNRTEESFTSSGRYRGSVPEISSTEEMHLRNGGQDGREADRRRGQSSQSWALLGFDDGGFQRLNRLLTLIQAGHSIDVEIHTQAVTELIGHQLGINAGPSTETGMRAPHGLKRGPVESDRLELRCDEP